MHNDELKAHVKYVLISSCCSCKLGQAPLSLTDLSSPMFGGMSVPTAGVAVAAAAAAADDSDDDGVAGSCRAHILAGPR